MRWSCSIGKHLGYERHAVESRGFNLLVSQRFCSYYPSKISSVVPKKVSFEVVDMASDTRPPMSSGRVREKVALKPGFHLADWMRLSNSMSRAGELSRKISLRELSEHSSQFDCWTAYKGKVYNISNYLPYHPGGEEILKKAAGKDCTALFDKYHKWVNCENILGKTVVGSLQTELEAFDSKEEEEDEQTEGKSSESEFKSHK